MFRALLIYCMYVHCTVYCIRSSLLCKLIDFVFIWTSYRTIPTTVQYVGIISFVVIYIESGHPYQTCCPDAICVWCLTTLSTINGSGCNQLVLWLLADFLPPVPVGKLVFKIFSLHYRRWSSFPSSFLNTHKLCNMLWTILQSSYLVILGHTVQ